MLSRSNSETSELRFVLHKANYFGNYYKADVVPSQSQKLKVIKLLPPLLQEAVSWPTAY